MNIGSVVSWIVCGLVVGLAARFLVPGRQSMGLISTTVIGIVGALVGGFIYSLIRGTSATPFSLEGQNWYGWIVAILGAMLLVWVYPMVASRR